MHMWSHTPARICERCTCLGAHIHLHSHAHLHTHVEMCPCMCAHNCMDTHQSTNMQGMPMHVCTHTNAWSHTCTQMCKVPMCSCMHAWSHKPAHTYTRHAHLHAHACSATHVQHMPMLGNMPWTHMSILAFMHMERHVSRHTCTHVHMCIHTERCTLTLVHTHAQECKHICKTHFRAHTCTGICAHAHTCELTHKYAHLHTDTWTCKNTEITFTHTSSHVSVHAVHMDICTHRCAHVCTHMTAYTCKHIHTHVCILKPVHIHSPRRHMSKYAHEQL